MQLTNLKVDSFLGIRHAEMPIGQVTIFAGDNWAGKSSLQQAIRIALSGEVARVKLKGDYKLLVKDGAKKAVIEAEVIDDDGLRQLVIAEIPTSGKATIPNCDSQIVKVCLDQEIIPTLAANDEKGLLKILFGVAGEGAASPAKIAKRMLELGADAGAVDEITPYLMAGLDGARAEAQAKVKACRAAWKAITGETYGTDKAEDWGYKFDPSKAQEKVDGLASHKKSLKDLKAKHADQQSVVNKAKLDWESLSNEYTCEKCGHSHKSDEAVAGELKEAYNKEVGGLAFIQTQIDKVEADIKAANDAKDELKEISSHAEKVTSDAANAHKDAQKWARIDELLSPDGIMQEILSESLKPINDRLKQSAAASGFGVVAINPDLSITYDNRLYGLCSEAQKWVAQAMLTEAIAFLSGVKLVALDRIDVLSVPNRGKLIKWCMSMAEDTGSQFILFGTLKSKPEIAGVFSYWVDGGDVK